MSRSTPSSPKNRAVRSFSTTTSNSSHTALLHREPSQSEKGPAPQYWQTSWQHTLPLRSEPYGRYQYHNDQYLDYNKPPTASISDRRSQRGAEVCISSPLPTPPYETQISLTPGPKSAPTLPTHARQESYARSYSTAGLPPTPPWTFSDMSTNSSPRFRSSSTFSHGSTTPTPIPGTMHSRDSQAQVQPGHQSEVQLSKDESSAAEKVATEHKCPKCEGGGFKTRFTTAVKDFFKRPPIDESKFERIEDRHWSE